MVFGLKGWYWKMPNGRLGVHYGEFENRAYLDASLESEVCKFLQVDLGLQNELEAYHNSKFSQTPKSAPVTPRRYRGKLSQILVLSTPV